jgi:hypothetical protein
VCVVRIWAENSEHNPSVRGFGDVSEFQTNKQRILPFRPAMRESSERSPKRQRVDKGSLHPGTGPLSSNTSMNLFHELRNLQQFGLLTDVTLRSGSCEVKAHRCVLAASSDYFKACLTSSMKESESNCVIELPLLDSGDSLYLITDFIYGKNVQLTAENIVPLLDSADKLNLDVLKWQCCAFLGATLTPQSCFNIYDLADRYNCTELCEEIHSFICRHFEGACRSEEFLELGHEEVARYLSSDALSVRNESSIFQAAVQWIRHSPETRACHLLSLFHKVILRFMTVQDIAQFIHPVVAGTSADSELFHSPQGYQCLLLVMNAYRWHALPHTDPEKVLGDGHGRLVDTPRNYARKQARRDRLFVLGGDDGYDDHSPFNSVIVLDEILKEWVPCPSFSQARSVPGSVAAKDRLCVIGGYDGARASSVVDIFDTSTCTWLLGPPLRQRRCSCVCVLYQDAVYCIGGVCGPQALNSVEKISASDVLFSDGSTNNSNTRHVSETTVTAAGWTECASLHENRSACGAVVLPRESASSVSEIILVCGGITTGGDTVATTEIFSDRTQVSSSLPRLPSAPSLPNSPLPLPTGLGTRHPDADSPAFLWDLRLPRQSLCNRWQRWDERLGLCGGL